ncbi:hypothetical protein ACFC4C_27565 [Streptomyces sp. NPDC056039]|uniref:hypothetical protein n=1 Tax=Streptomyces sp. NPDC056039 TaxID=3345687 RepID=UPI0035D8BDE6
MSDVARDDGQDDNLAEDEWDWEQEEKEYLEEDEDAQRVREAAKLADTDPDRGIPALLALIADTDLGTVDNLEYRADALNHLLNRGGSAATAAWWVINTSNPWREMQRVYWVSNQYTGPAQPKLTEDERQQEHVAALRHLVASSDLQDDLRWPAIGELIDMEGRKGYEAVKGLAPDINIADLATGAFGVDETHAYSIARWVAADQDQPAEVRVEAAEWLLDEEAWCADDAVADALRGTPVGAYGRRKLLVRLLAMENAQLEVSDPSAYERQQEKDCADHVPGVVRLAVQEAERNHHAGPLEGLLQSWVNAALRDQWEGSWSYAHRVVDDAVEQLMNIAFRHQELRKRLAADISAAHPDADWHPLLIRGVDLPQKQENLFRSTSADGHFAFKATPECQFALCRTARGTPDPIGWELTVLQGREASATSFAGRLLVQGEQTFIHFPDDLNERPHWSAELIAGLSAISRAEIPARAGGTLYDGNPADWRH